MRRLLTLVLVAAVLLLGWAEAEQAALEAFHALLEAPQEEEDRTAMDLLDDLMAGRFKMQTPREALLETKLLIELLDLPGAHFTANHMSNYSPLKGTLGVDTAYFLALIDAMLSNVDKVKQRTVYRHG